MPTPPTRSAGPAPAALRAKCPACTATLAVRADMAGRRVKCRCGNLFDLPSLADLTAAAERAAAEAAIARGYAPARKKLATEDEHPQPKENFILDVAAPAVLLPVGVLLCVVQAMRFDKNPHTFAEVIGPTMVSIVLSLGLMVVAVLGAGLGLGMVFHGRPWQTALKIAGIALIPTAVGGIIDHSVGGINGNILGVLSAVALYTALVKGILRMPWDHTGIIVLLCWSIRAFTMYAMYRIEGAGAWI